MQEEVNDKTFTLCVQATKLTARVLIAAMRKFLESNYSERQAEKNGRAQERGKAKERNRQDAAKPRGKQSIKTLQEQGAELTNIEITDKNIKSFDRVARKYGIDYSLKKDVSVDPPRYLIFFKAKDVEVMTTAFKEYTSKSLAKAKKPSIRKKLSKAVHRVNHRQRQKTRQRGKDQER